MFCKKSVWAFASRRKNGSEEGSGATQKGTVSPGTTGAWTEWWRSLLMFCGAGVYTELCLHLCIFHELGEHIVFPVMFALVFGMLCQLITGWLPKIPKCILTVILMCVPVFYAEVQLIYYTIFGNFLSVNLIQMGGAALTNFGGQIFSSIYRCFPKILLLFLPLLVGLFLWIGRRTSGGMRRSHPHQWRQSLVTLGMLLFTIWLTCGMMYTNTTIYHIFMSSTTGTDISMKNIGMLATTEQELYYMLVGTGDADEGINDVSIGTTTEASLYSGEVYNVLNIDFSALASSTEDESLKALDEYLETLIPTEKNEYTGFLEGYNLITICAESFWPYLISEELTPALYEMSTTGFIFENFYGTFQSVTTNGEYTFCTGLYPDMSRTKTDSSFDVAANNLLPFCLGNILEGYLTYAYHNYFADFYNRSITHTNMGYTFKAADSGLSMEIQWPSSDLDMIVASIDDYISTGETFHAYYMTFSGHYSYNFESNAMSIKNQEAVADLNYTEEVLAYLACNLELEYAMEYLLERLEEAGIAEKTCIVLTTDHYPYGLDEDSCNELAGADIYNTLEKYRNSFICYVPGLEENIVVEEYCSTADILPTLLNLFGVEYDSRLLAGTDVLSSGTHMAILYDQSFITEDFRYDASTDTLTITTEDIEIDQDTLESYQMYVENKFTLSTEILNNNYYAHVFGTDQEETQDEEASVIFSDISEKNIFQQANVLRMYRKGYVDAESDDYFGGSSPCYLGEYVDVLYRISGCPETSDIALPEGYEDDVFNEDYKYYDAVCWAYEIGLLQTGDVHEDYDDRMDYRTAALFMYRYAAWYGLDMEVDTETVEYYAAERPLLGEEYVIAIVWCMENNTIRDALIETVFKKYATKINRFQMTNFLCYFSAYQLGL